ncbi:hypothetical protein JHK82_046360 [Glycine max]|uniref:Uncharacterized protein n=2 Tax=Glycine subgen. Soja TaxID=1462606 RepID=K7MJJ9_SOYBN|nr:hypothetical protein JHK86_046260 [Glycine max]KAG4932036.1 hypothetical protein JHK87_046038 [Glycine soja]KAG4942157.1 hypothetical protein JHK85_046803 [Glycine max]KAG5096506.1 hypothetical protein JHK82_046360 [Glycine max]KAG5101299.1 hypothetical protein JHK84_046268 [Glycine max]
MRTSSFLHQNIYSVFCGWFEILLHQMFYFVINEIELIMVLGHMVYDTTNLLWLWLARMVSQDNYMNSKEYVGLICWSIYDIDLF